jgi:hypothetical protein
MEARKARGKYVIFIVMILGEVRSWYDSVSVVVGVYAARRRRRSDQ